MTDINQIYVRDICQRYAWDILEIFFRFAGDMLQICRINMYIAEVGLRYA